MSVRSKFVSALGLSALLLAGCGGGGDGDVNLGGGSGGSFSGGGSSSSGSGSSSGGSSGGSTGGSTPDASLYTFSNLSVFEASDDYAGEDNGGKLQGLGSTPYIEHYAINPVTASDLVATDLAVVSDFSLTVDGIEVDENESFPLLQKVLGNEVFLTTALVFDVSGSMAHADMSQLVDEAKDYVAAAQASADEAIAGQSYVVWAFGRDISDLTGGFTTNTTTINAALDSVVTLNDSGALGRVSNLHRAVVEVVGRYNTDDYDFSLAPSNDLYDRVTNNGALLSQMVLFSSGPDSYAEMSTELMVGGIQSQSFDVLETGGTAKRYKPVFYFVVGDDEDGDTYSNLADNAETVTNINLVGGEYVFSDDLIQSQSAAIEARLDIDNQHIFRYAFVPRLGDHVTILKSNSGTFNQTVTTTWDELDNAAVGTPEEELASLVEITGMNGEYLSFNMASLAEMSTFAPATRWTAVEYGAGDYSWNILAGVATKVDNADGTTTISNMTTSPVTLQLTNTVLGHTETITILD